MLQSVAHRWILVALLLVGLAVLTVRKDFSDIGESVHATSKSVQDQGSGTVGGPGETKVARPPHSFSAAYYYCYVDENGRPMEFHERRRLHWLPMAPPEGNDRRLIDTDECQ